MEIERFLLSLLSTVLSGFLLERVVECLLECRSCPKKYSSCSGAGYRPTWSFIFRIGSISFPRFLRF